MERILYLLVLLWVSARFSLWLHVKACEKYPDFAAALLSTRGLYVLVGSCIVQYATFPTLRSYLTPLFTESTIFSFSLIFMFYTLVPWMLLGWIQQHTLSNLTLTNLYCVLIEQLVMGFCFAPMFFSIFDESTADASSPTTIASNAPLATQSIGGGGGFLSTVLSAVIVPLQNTTDTATKSAVPMSSAANPVSMLSSMSESVLIITTINVADRVVEGLAVFSYLCHHLRPLTKNAQIVVVQQQQQAQPATAAAASDGHPPAAHSSTRPKAGQFTLPPSRPMIGLESQGMVQNLDTMLQHLTNMWSISSTKKVSAQAVPTVVRAATVTMQNEAATAGSSTLAIVDSRDLDRLVASKLDDALRNQRQNQQQKHSKSQHENDDDDDQNDEAENENEDASTNDGEEKRSLSVKPSRVAVRNPADDPAAPCDHNVGFVPIGPAVSRDEEMLVSDTPSLPDDMQQRPNDEMKPDMDEQSSSSATGTNEKIAANNSNRGRRRRNASVASANINSTVHKRARGAAARRAARDSSGESSGTERQHSFNRRQGLLPADSTLARTTAANTRYNELIFPSADASSNIFDDDNDTPVGQIPESAAGGAQPSVFSSGDEAMLAVPHHFNNSRQQHKSMKWVSFASNVDKPSAAPSTEGASSSSSSTASPPTAASTTFRRSPVPPRWDHVEAQEEDEPVTNSATTPVAASSSMSYFSSSTGDDDTAAATSGGKSYIEPLKQRTKRTRRGSAMGNYGEKKCRSSSRIRSRRESGT